MKRTWIWGTCATIIAGGAIALAQQDGAGPAPPTPPVAAAGGTAPLQEAPPVAAAAGAQATTTPPPTSPPFGAARASNDPFAGQGAAAASAPSADAFGRGPMKASAQGNAGGGDWDAVPSQNGPNMGRSGGGRAFSGQSGFGGFGGAMNLGSGQNMPNMLISAEAKAFREAEQKVQQLAARIRSIAAENPNYAKTDEDLKAAVKAAFEARQAMQKAEVKRLKDKLAEIEAQVTRRESAKDVLIEDRYHDLKNGSGGAPTDVFYPASSLFPSADPFPVPTDGGTPVPAGGAGFSSGGPFFSGGGFGNTPPPKPTPDPEAKPKPE